MLLDRANGRTEFIYQFVPVTFNLLPLFIDKIEFPWALLVNR